MQVRVSEIAHSFPGTSMLFQNLSFDLNPGDLVALTGPSGSGKSTLLSMLAGWEKPESGQIALADIASIGWVFQNPLGSPARSALDHVSLPIWAKGGKRHSAESQALEIMGRFDLGHLAQRQYRHLSGGEAQRLMLARAVAKKPSLLLVDEPTAQLDPMASATVNSVLGELASQDMIVVVATHDPQTAASCSMNVSLV